MEQLDSPRTQSAQCVWFSRTTNTVVNSKRRTTSSSIMSVNLPQYKHVSEADMPSSGHIETDRIQALPLLDFNHDDEEKASPGSMTEIRTRDVTVAYRWYLSIHLMACLHAAFCFIFAHTCPKAQSFYWAGIQRASPSFFAGLTIVILQFIVALLIQHVSPHCDWRTTFPYGVGLALVLLSHAISPYV